MGNNPSLIAKAEMLIRGPVAEVFEAFVNPAITSQFWFSKGSGRLVVGQQVTNSTSLQLRPSQFVH